MKIQYFSKPAYTALSKLFRRSSLILLVAIFFSVSFTEATAGTYAQDHRLNLNFSNASPVTIIKYIEDSSEFNFFYQNEQIQAIGNCSINVKDASIDQVLAILLKGTPVTYTIDNRHIVFHSRSEQPVTAERTSASAPAGTVSGVVTEADGTPILGATVSASNDPRRTTITDHEGRFSITGVRPDDVLNFTFVGKKDISQPVGERSSFEITMDDDAFGLEDIVVIGYGTQRRKDLTGSIVSVDLEKTREAGNISILQSLQGYAAGLNVGITREGGAVPSLSIRGQNSLNAENSAPLVVIDGVIMPEGSAVLGYLNPADVKSVDVLKDAGSVSIYGSRAANGVLLITTKMGATESGKPIFNYSGSYTIQTPSHRLKPLNRDQLLLRIRDNLWPTAYMGPDYTTANPDFDITSGWSGIPEFLTGFENGTDYDWYDEATQTGSIHNHHLNMSGRSDRTNYFVSAGYTDYNGYIKNDLYERWTGRINIESKITDWFKMGVQSSVATTNMDGQTPRMGDIMRMSPFTVPYDKNGEMIRQPMSQNVPNPFEPLYEDDYARKLNLFGNIFAQIDLPWVKGLSYKVNYSHNYTTERRFRTQPTANTYTGGASKYNSMSYSWTVDNVISYERTFAKDHNLNVTLVAGREENEFEATSANGAGFANIDLGYNNLEVAENQTISSSAWDETSLYYMARAYYAYKQKYMITLTVRRDGYSGFGADHKFGVFPSAAVAWLISNEKFMASKPASIEFLKLRFSYGSTGNRALSPYQTLASVEAGTSYIWGDNGTIGIGQHPKSMANSNLRWESTLGFNVGLDFAFLKNRIRGSFEYYNTNTSNILYSIKIPYVNGYADINQNIGKVHNWGVELSLNTTNIKTRNFTWDMSFNFSLNRNKLVSVLGPSNDVDGDGVEDDLVASSLFIGSPINSIYDYNVIGLYQLTDTDIPSGYKPGQYRAEDIDGSGQITSEKDRKIIGNKDPNFRFSIGSTFTYKNLSLSVFFNSIQGGNGFYMAKNDPIGMGFGVTAARSNSVEFDYWTPRNPNAKYAQINEATPNGIAPYQSRSFVRLQDVSLAYNFSKRLLSKMRMQGLKVYVSGKNLYTWTNWDGWDPETGQGLTLSGTPILMNITFGLDISF